MSAKCANCQAKLAGFFCSSCGQKVHTLKRSVGFLLGDALGSLFSYENKFWKTLVPLFLRPGLLTQDHVEGRQQRYFAPMRMFLLVSILVFFAPDTMNVPTYELSGEWAEPAPASASFFDRAKTGLDRLRSFDPEDTETLTSFNVTVAKRFLTLYMIIGVFGLAFFLKLIHRNRFLVDHVVFAVHIAIFMYMWNWLARLPPWPPEVSAIITAIGQVGYMFAAYWRVYGWPGWKGRTASIVGGIFVNVAFAVPYGITAQMSAVYMLMPPAA